MIKGVLCFQETIYRGTQVFHENFSAQEIIERIETLLQGKMKQCEIATESLNAIILVSKKGKMTVKTKKISATEVGVTVTNEKTKVLSHYREKQYIL